MTNRERAVDAINLKDPATFVRVIEASFLDAEQRGAEAMQQRCLDALADMVGLNKGLDEVLLPVSTTIAALPTTATEEG